MPSAPEATHPGLAAAERLRRVRDALEAGEIPDATDAGWLAQGLGRYLAGAAAGVRLEDALGVAVPPGGAPWWSEQRRAERDAAIRALAATFPGSASARALATAAALRRYGSVGWRLDRRRGGPAGDDPRRRLLFEILAADEDPPTSMRRIYDIVTG